jgi:hypothetical protein
MASKTNEQTLRAILKDLDTIESALFVERVHLIMKMTKAEVEKNPEAFRTPFTNEHTYARLCDKVLAHTKHLG